MSQEMLHETLGIYRVDGWSDNQRNCMKQAAVVMGFAVDEAYEDGKVVVMAIHEDGIHDAEFFKVFSELLEQPSNGVQH